MNKSTSRAARLLICALGAMIALGAIAVLLSHLVYGRSLRATLYESQLRRRFVTDRTAESERARLEAKRVAGEKRYTLPDDLALCADIREDDVGGMQVFTLNPDADSPRVVLYLHGGAYINPFNAYQWRFMDRLAVEAGCPVVAPAYHLAPFADYARAYRDLGRLWRTLTDRCPDRQIVLMGDSAGGGLALGLAQALVRADAPLPEKLILFSPWVDVSMNNPDIDRYVPTDPVLHLDLVRVHGLCWANGADTTFWQVSPLYGDMTGLPPVTLYCGTRELLYPDILLAAERLEAAGTPVTLHVGRGLNHDYPLMPLPESDRAVRDVIDAVR